MPDLDCTALEVRVDAAGLQTRGRTLVRGSDAHYLDDIGGRTCVIELVEVGLSGLRDALDQDRVLG